MEQEETLFCKQCSSFVPKNKFCFVKGKKRRNCKKCHAFEEKVRRLKFTENQKIEHQKKVMDCYYKQRKSFHSLKKDDPKLIHKWVNRNKSRKDLKSKKVRRLDYTFLKSKLEESLKIFPYMILRKIDGPKAFLASIDRINPNLDYSEDNIAIVPLWFNSGKLDLQIYEFLAMMKTHFNNANVEKLYKKD